MYKYQLWVKINEYQTANTIVYAENDYAAKLLGESQYGTVFDQTDSIAEHIRALGSYAPTSLARMIELSKIDELVAIPSPLVMMSELAQDNDKYIMELRAGIAIADAADEPAVGNFLQDLLDAHQKHGWMLRSFTR